LIPLILDTPRQELSTHTFSHFYCLAEGVTAEAFRADLASARAIMQTVAGVTPRSIVFPRNEHNPAFDSILLESGITTYRGNPASWMWRPGRNNLAARGGRLLDAYVPVAGMHTVRWKDIPQPNGTYDVTASAFVRPNSRGLRLRRLIATVRHAAKHGEVAHLWWHPHNFGVRTEENLQVVRAILVELSRCREEFGMQSLTMIGAAEEAARRTASSATS
ncbi:MAG: polysaccharide deacetylase, partial [Candidatus Eremiobacteraeota bacterium]|nr:polysaccharide deacetylase [Candidatus Eremiobacteraeota bacterium]